MHPCFYNNYFKGLKKIFFLIPIELVMVAELATLNVFDLSRVIACNFYTSVFFMLSSTRT